MKQKQAKQQKQRKTQSVADFVNERVPDPKPGEPAYEEMKQRLAKMEKANGSRAELEWRVGEKGGVSVYGLGRFPVTLYYEQWCAILDEAGPLKAFLEEQRKAGKLSLRKDRQGR